VSTDELVLPLEVEDFLVWLSAEQGRAPNTIGAYRRDLTAYLAAIRRSPLDITEADLVRYVEHLRTERAPASVARALVAIRSLHRFLLDEGLSETNPAAEVEAPRTPKGLPKALSEAEVERLLGAVVGDDPPDRRDRAILEVLYGTGIRISELVGLSLADLDVDGALLRAFGKGSKERLVPLGRLARQALVQWLGPGGRGAFVPTQWARRGDAEAVFLNRRGGRLTRQGAWGIVRRYGEQVGLADRLSPHVLRHSCATHMIDHGADIRAVQEILGHASVSTTQIYTLVSTERLWQVYREAHPRADRPRIR
jgi:integrase/recombinase XerD